MVETRSVVIFSQVAIYREGICAYLDDRSDFEVAGSSGALVNIAAAAVDGVDLCILDMTGFDQSQLHLFFLSMRQAETPVVVIGLDGAEASIVRCLEFGASGYVPKDASLDELRQVVEKTLANGACVLDGDVAALVERLRQTPTMARSPDDGHRALGLSGRERQVAELLAEAMTNQEIANSLGISIHTAKHHVRQTLSKLGIDRRGEMTALRGAFSLQE